MNIYNLILSLVHFLFFVIFFTYTVPLVISVFRKNPYKTSSLWLASIGVSGVITTFLYYF